MVRKFCEKINFPTEAIDYLESVYPKVDMAHLREIGRLFLQKDETCPTLLEAESKRLDLPVSTVALFMLIDLTETVMWDSYKKANLPEELFWENAEDLTFKLNEHFTRTGIWGNGAIDWYRKFFDLTVVKIGRLQYEEYTWQEEDFPPLKTGDQVFKVHIPASGPLTPESVEESFQRAKKFFSESGILKTDYFPIMCASWLLYKPHYEVFPEGGNIRKFQDMFTPVSGKERKDDFVRVFNRPDDGNYDDLPEDTTLQRNFKKFLQNGGKMGLGRGVTFR